MFSLVLGFTHCCANSISYTTTVLVVIHVASIVPRKIKCSPAFVVSE